MTQGIIVTHGELGREIAATAATIFGQFEGVETISNTNKSPQALEEELADLVGERPDEQFIVFIDFFGGSCCHACLKLEQTHDNVKLITGVNLPMLLAFLYKRDAMSFDDLPFAITARGVESIQIVRTEDL